MSSKATNILSSPQIPGIEKAIMTNMNKMTNLDSEIKDFSNKVK